MNRPDSDSEPDGVNRYISTAKVSRALGVSVTTVKRWVDEGILPAHRTAGGHRKLLLSDVLRLARDGNLPQANLAQLHLETGVTPALAGDIRASLLRALLAADAGLIRTLLRSAYLDGMPLEVLADQIISPVMHDIGHGWATGKIEVHREHLGTQVCVAGLHLLKSLIETNADAARPVAIGGSPEHDHYILASLLAQMVLLDKGWEAINLGPHTPFASFHAALDEYRPRMVWLSVNHLTDPERFVSEYAPFYEAARQRGVSVAIGGVGLSPELRARLKYTSFGDGLTQFAEFARSLYRRPECPKRGRPRLHP